MNAEAADTDTDDIADLEADRLCVLTHFEACAGAFWDAVQAGDSGKAQAIAMTSLEVLARLFTHPNAKAHLLLTSLISLIYAAQAGHTDQVLLAKAGSIPGTKRRLKQAFIGGFAISAVDLLTRKASYAALAARKAVAEMLTEFGVSNRTGDHGEAKPVTESAIRNWIEKRDDYPLQLENAAAMAGIDTINLDHLGEIPEGQLLEYLRERTRQVVAISKVL